MWPPVRQFESYDRVPWEPFASRAARRPAREKARARHRWIAAAVVVMAASGLSAGALSAL